VPSIKGRDKTVLVSLTEVFGKPFQFNARFRFRIICQVTGNDLLLMKMIHLDRDITKDLPDSRSAVQNDCRNGISLFL